MPERLYRHRRPSGEPFEMIDSAALMAMIFYHEPAGTGGFDVLRVDRSPHEQD
jgi:hypothetical protein